MAKKSPDVGMSDSAQTEGDEHVSDSLAEGDATASQSTPTTVTTTTTTVEGIATTLINEAPEPQPNAISQANDDRAAKAEAELDAEGNAFDASIHTGTKTTAGAWRKKSGRKPNGSAPGGTAGNAQSSRPKLNIPGGGQSGTQQTDAAVDSKIVNARAGGTTAANLLIMLSVGIGGPEWLPRQPPIIPYDEKAALESAFADYFQSKGWEDLPPGWALVAGIGMYALPRFAMPRTAERARGFRNWVAGKYINWKAKRARKKYARKFGPETDIERAERDSRERYEVERMQAGGG